MSEKKTVYEIITDRIIAQLEQGTTPWNKPWTARGDAGLPHNFVTKKAYRGINTWLLLAAGYTSPAFLTFKQARDLGGSVRKGEKGWPVVFWKFGEVETKAGEVKDYAFCRFYTVFNVSQCDGLQLPLADEQNEGLDDVPALDVCESMVQNWSGRPEIKHGPRGAFYSPSLDYVSIPERSAFNGPEAYYSTLFHELTHSTGHAKRLNRFQLGTFGDKNYSKEELVAEMGAAFLCGFAGIENSTIDNSAAYLASWLKVLKSDSKMIISAASQAQKAVDLILNSTPVYAPRESTERFPVPADLVSPIPAPAQLQFSLF
jgi:antirestriction protein ArdC